MASGKMLKKREETVDNVGMESVSSQFARRHRQKKGGRQIMKAMIGIVVDSKRLDLDEDLALPPGTHVRIGIEKVGKRGDYATRLAEYYANCPKEALEEEKKVALEVESKKEAEAPTAVEPEEDKK